MFANLSLSPMELILMFLGAVVLGFTVHFFISSRRRLNETTKTLQQKNTPGDEWKLRYLNDMDKKDADMSHLKTQLDELREENEILAIEAREIKQKNKSLEESLLSKQNLPEQVDAGSKETPDANYKSKLQQALQGLEAHQQMVGQLLGNLDILSEKEEQLTEALHSNDQLKEMLDRTQSDLSAKQAEIQNIQQRAGMTKELKAMLDSAYNEFNVMQGKMLKMESQLRNSQEVNLELEDTREENMRISRDLKEYKSKSQQLHTDNEDLKQQLWEATEKLSEANLQRQQMSRKIAHLEELNNDLNVVTDANKNLEGQLRRIGELESQLNMVEQERDNLKERLEP